MENELRLRLHNNGKWTEIIEQPGLGNSFENKATTLVIELPQSTYGFMHFLEFLKPSGSTISTGAIEEKIDDSGIHYVEFKVGSGLIDERGRYQMQYVGRKGSQTITVVKSELKALDVFKSINSGLEISTSNPDFITWATEKINKMSSSISEGDKSTLEEAKAYADKKIAEKHLTIYGVSGIGDENPELTRTYNAAGIKLIKTKINGNIEVTANDPAFQEFFNFKESTDELGNVFVNIPPMSFKIDRIENNEVKAISVKLYETGDENLGFEVHPFFRHYINETEWDGVTSRQVAKYLLYYQTEADGGDGKVHSKSNKKYASNTYLNWDKGRQAIKDTKESYAMINWHFISFFRWITLIYLARVDVYKFFEKEDVDGEGDEGNPIAQLYNAWNSETGLTDSIVSHTGMNIENTSIKLFNIDDALHGVSCGGIYVNSEGKYGYSNIADFDINKDTGAVEAQQGILQSMSVDNVEADNITKMGIVDENEYLQMPAALRLATSDLTYDCSKAYHNYYCSKAKFCGNPAESDNPIGRAQIIFFGWTDGPCIDNGLFSSLCNLWVTYAWRNIYYGCRLCKLPL